MSESGYLDALPAQHRLHWYVLERVLGQGGFGITYLARDTNLDQMVAIKEYLPGEVASRRPDGTVRARTEAQRERYRWGLDRFIREARTLARFDHPNIVRVLSVFELNDTAYMVMRFEAGTNFATQLDQRGILPESDLLRILLPILDGLELVHNAGFIHRDIKPDNIHIREDGSPVLLDFGSARHALGKARTLTILVAPGYAPIEQYYSDSESQGPWTDIYGLGATAYRAIAGTAPIDAIARSKGILGSTRELLVAAKLIGKGRYSDRLLDAIDHALAFAEKDRPQTIAEWRDELTGERLQPHVAPVAQPAALPSGGPAAQPAPAFVPPAAAVHAAAQPSPANAAAIPHASGVRSQVAWAIAGAVIAALATYVALMRVPDPAVTAVAVKPPSDVAPPIKPDDTKKDVNGKLTPQEPAGGPQVPPQPEPPTKPPSDTGKSKPASQQQVIKKGPDQGKTAAAKKGGAVVTPPPAPPIQPDPVPPTSPGPIVLIPPTPAPPPVITIEKKDEQPTLAQRYEKIEAAARNASATEAIRMVKPFADKGHAPAQVRLGDIYAERGLYIPAYMNYSLAARAGYAGAEAKRAQIAARLQREEIEQANKSVNDFKPSSAQ